MDIGLIFNLLILAGVLTMAADWAIFLRDRKEGNLDEQPQWAKLAEEYTPLLLGLVGGRFLLSQGSGMTLIDGAMAGLLVGLSWWLLDSTLFRWRREQQPDCVQQPWGNFGEWLPPFLAAILLLLSQQVWPLALLTGALITAWLVPQLKSHDKLELAQNLDTFKLTLIERFGAAGISALCLLPFLSEPTQTSPSGLPDVGGIVAALALATGIWWALGLLWQRWLHESHAAIQQRWWHLAGATAFPIFAGLLLFKLLIVDRISHFDFGALLAGLFVVIVAILIFDLLFLRRRRQQGANTPSAVELAKSLVVVVTVVMCLRQFVIEPFRIPSASMMPTLLNGDFILVNKFAYGVRLPVSETKVFGSGKPERGDIAVFRYPLGPEQDYIKRIVGIPGDTIKTNGRVILINDKPVPQKVLGPYQGPQHSAFPGVVSAESFGDGEEHLMMIDPRITPARDATSVAHQGLIPRETVVPAGQYFVMGDNRDHSADSRFWEFVPEENLAGKAFYIWMNLDPESKTPLTDRIFTKLQ